MKRLLLIATAIWLIAGGAQAQWISGMTPSASNAAVPTARTNLGLGVVSVHDYGSIADGTTHPLSELYTTLAAAQVVCPEATALTQQIDWCAIQAAIGAVKASVPNTGTPFRTSLLIPAGNYYLGAIDTVNLTCISDPATTGCPAAANNGDFKIEASGAVFSCNTTGVPCVYGLGSRFVHIRNLTLDGSCTNKPTAGLMFGRTISNVSADFWKTEGVRTKGCFTWAPYYNMASEDFTDIASYWQNADTTVAGTSYAGILDGGNHWDVPELYGITVSITVDTHMSFNEPQFLGSMFVMANGSTGQGLWIYGTRNLRLSNVYINSAGSNCIVIFTDTSGHVQSVPDMFNGEFHCEPFTGATQTTTFFITGGTSGTHINPTLKGFKYRDHYNFATTQVFKRDAFVDTVTMRDADIHISNAAGTPDIGDSTTGWYFFNRYLHVPAAIATRDTANMSYGNGFQSLAAATTGNANTALGDNTLKALTTANNNTAVGHGALATTTVNGGSTALGTGAGGLATGASGVFVGVNAGSSVTSGGSNVIIGPSVASTTLTTGTNNVLIGTNNSIDTAAAGTGNTIQIGAGSTSVIDATGAGTPATSTTTVRGQLNVVGAINQFGAAAGTPGHLASGQATAPALTSCGTGSPAIVGTDTAGTVTTGTNATGCVITFNVAYVAAPHCVVTWQTTPAASQSYTVAAGAITLTQTSASGRLVNYICIGRSGG